MSVAVLIPWRDGDPAREAAFGYVVERWRTETDYDVIIGECSEGPWIKAHAVEEAFRRTLADVIIVADADVWCDGVPDAVQAIRDGQAWAVPHITVRRLTEAATALIYAGAEFDPAAPLDRTQYVGVKGGGIVVLDRRILEDVPLDPAFENWGGEDISWGYALTAIHGAAWRGSADLFHLYHPLEPRQGPNYSSFEGRRRYRMYHEAQGRPSAMGLLIDPVREALSNYGR